MLYFLDLLCFGAGFLFGMAFLMRLLIYLEEREHFGKTPYIGMPHVQGYRKDPYPSKIPPQEISNDKG